LAVVHRANYKNPCPNDDAMKCAKTLGPQYWILWAICILAGCVDKEPKNMDEYLIRVGNRVITVVDFNNAFEINKTAYSHNDMQDPVILREARRRFLNQMVEEMILLEKAGVLGIEVPDSEVNKAIIDIRADYPDETFEKALLKSAISYSRWKDRLKIRLLIEKVVQRDLEEQIKITPEDIRKYYESDHANDIFDSDAGEVSKKIDGETIKNLRRKKAEETYGRWIKGLKQQYKVEINQIQWEKISGS